MHYNLIAEEWLGHPYSRGQVVVRGNVMRAGTSTEQLAFFMVGGSGDLDVYLRRQPRRGSPRQQPLPQHGRYTTTPIKIDARRRRRRCRSA